MLNSPSLGILYGISIGPGDPELIAIKGIKLLEKCPVVAFPAGLRNQPGIAQQIVTPWLKPHQIQLSLNFPYVQDETILNQAWQVAATEVWQYLQNGQDVAFACEGDVSFYSTFTYLAQTLKQLHPEALVQTVPGICSPIAAVAALGIPLTIRNQRLAILPALYNVGVLESALNWADVVVLMKVSSVYEQVWKILQQRGLLNNAYVVERATLPTQVIYQGLGDRPHLKLPYFSLMIVTNSKVNSAENY
ncbi:MAG: precorrin-2 C(20)-methyltransferase [Microcoleaceae cyanobacterium]